jgi:AraC-like DNA-binding protein
MAVAAASARTAASSTPFAATASSSAAATVSVPPPTAGTDWAQFRPGTDGGITLMQAHFTEHAFERHSHDTYSIGLTLSGVQTFNCRGGRHASQPGDVLLFNPDEPHDGSRGTDEGFGYAILYVEPEIVRACFDVSAGTAASEYFRSPLVHDRQAALHLEQAVAALAQPQESLRADALISSALIGLFQRYGEIPQHASPSIEAGRLRMNRVRSYIDAHFAEDLTVAMLAHEAGLSRVHLTRAFSRHFGVPPHIYLNRVRLAFARRAIRSGQTLVEVALAAGFADQSHFNRRFKGSVGVSPGVWLAQMTQM